MNRDILYVLGAPGVGKTTLVRSILATTSATLRFTDPPAPKFTIAFDGTWRSIVAAGYYKGETFDGADTVPYSGATKAIEYWAANQNRPDSVVDGVDVGVVVALTKPAELTIFDGARFATRPSLERLRKLAPDHRIIGVHLVASPEELAARRMQRGSNQNPAWMKGATTGARNIAALIGAQEVRAEGTAERVLARVLDVVHYGSVRAVNL